jgi:hypothetical protein
MDRRGTSVLARVLFVGITALMTGMVLSFSLLSTQIGMREEIIADVEHGGLFAVELISQKVQAADTVLVAGDELTLTKGGQTTVITVEDDKIKVDEDGTISYLTPDGLKVSDLDFILLGETEANRRGVTVTFSIASNPASSAAPLFNYSRRFHMTVAGR